MGRARPTTASRVLVAVGAALALSVSGAVVLPAAGADVSDAVTETFTIADHPAGVPFDFTVPVGVTSIAVQAAGGHGGSYAERPGGAGALVSVTIPVVEGQVLTVTLGDNGVSLADP